MSRVKTLSDLLLERGRAGLGVAKSALCLPGSPDLHQSFCLAVQLPYLHQSGAVEFGRTDHPCREAGSGASQDAGGLEIIHIGLWSGPTLPQHELPNTS